jgi:cobalt-zinc-cadmium efflux system membrane fusion protein
MNRKIPMILLVVVVMALGGLGGAAYWTPSTKPVVVRVLRALKSLTSATASAQSPANPSPPPMMDHAPWDGLVPIDAEQWRAIGLRTAPVKPQNEPMKLELTGTTAYDPDSVSQIRPRFASKVTKVFKNLGDHVKRGEPLVELSSDELAKAKTDLQVQYVEWLRYHRLYIKRKDLFTKGALAEIEWTKTQNDEIENHMDYILARHKLLIFGLTPEEIDPLITGLNEESMNALGDENVSQMANMMIRAPMDGFVVKREVAQDNLYDTSSVLMVLAPLDHLRVYGNLYESDLDLVQIGQDVDVVFPFLQRSIPSQVQGISNQVDPETHAMRIRTTISNPGGLLKSDMLVQVVLKIPPVPGFTVVPRRSVVTNFGKFYVFVLQRGSSESGLQTARDRPARFERREIKIVQERSDQVVVSQGLKPGEYVATNGSLILEQMYEDLSVVDTGTPAH